MHAAHCMVCHACMAPQHAMRAFFFLTRKDQMQACPHCKKTLGASHVNTQFGASGMLVNTRGRLRKVNCNFNALTPAGAVGEHSCAKRREY